MTNFVVENESHEAGLALMSKLFAGAPPSRRMPRRLFRYTVDHLFGDLWQGEALSIQERSLITCAVLTALGRESEQQLHFRGARNLGIERVKLEELITHVAHYAGWPVAVGAGRVLDEIWEDMDAVTNAEEGVE